MTFADLKRMTKTISGVSATPLSGLGTARWYRPGERPNPANVTAASPETERSRFDDAQATAREELEIEHGDGVCPA